jgi:hypothetical protein
MLLCRLVNSCGGGFRRFSLTARNDGSSCKLGVDIFAAELVRCGKGASSNGHSHFSGGFQIFDCRPVLTDQALDGSSISFSRRLLGFFSGRLKFGTGKSKTAEVGRHLVDQLCTENEGGLLTI